MKTFEQFIVECIDHGRSAGLTLQDIANKHNVSLEEIESQLKIGIEIEKEHTDDDETAKRIAMDHLTEFAQYYDALVKMEKGLKENE